MLLFQNLKGYCDNTIAALEATTIVSKKASGSEIVGDYLLLWVKYVGMKGHTSSVKPFSVVVFFVFFFLL